MALRPGAGGGGSFMYPVGGGLGPPQGLIPMQQQQGFPMVQVMQPNMQGMMGMNFGPQMPPGAMPMQGTMPMAMAAQGMTFMGQPPFVGMRAPGPQFSVDVQKQMAEEHQKRLEQQARLLEEDRKRRQFEEQKQKLRLLSSVKPKTGEKSRDDALEAIKGNLDGFSRDAKMHPPPSSHPKKPDSSPSHSSVISHSLTPTFPEEDDDFSDFIQGPVEASPPPPPPSSGPTSMPQSLLHSVPITSAAHHSVTSSSLSAFKGPSLEEKLLSSCDFHANGRAQVKFESRVPLAQMGQREQVAARFRPTARARNWAAAPSEEPSAAFVAESPAATMDSGVGVFPQQEHMQPLMPAWMYNDSLVPDLFKKVLEFTVTPAGIDTAKLYPILMSSGLPREALGQIWASANRTTPGKLTKEELYGVLAMIGAAQSGLPAMSLDVLGRFPTPPVPSLPALAVGVPPVPPVLPQHPTSAMAQPPVAVAVPAAAAASSMGVTSSAATQPPASFVASFPPGAKTDDDDFQEFQEAPKPGTAEDSFADFQGESGASFPSTTPCRSSGPTLLTPVTGSSSSSDKYAVFKQLSVEQTADAAPPASDSADKYSVFRELERPADRKPVGEGFADFKCAGADDGFADFKTADGVSPLDPPDQAKMFQPTFPPPFPKSQTLQPQLPASLSQPRNPLDMADLDLFSSLAPPGPPGDTKLPALTPPVTGPPLAAVVPPASGAKPSGGGVDDFGDFALFGSSSVAPSTGAGGGGSAVQDDFADFMAFGGSGETGGDIRASAGGTGATGEAPSRRGAPDKYDVFKRLSLEGGSAYDDPKETGGSFASPRVDADDFADFRSSKFCTALGASEKSLTDKLAKEDSSSVKSLDLPSIGGSSAGKDDSEDALSVQLDMKLSDVGGDLKHVMSDSSLDLPGLSAHQPPAAETDDSRFDPFGTLAAGSSAAGDRPDREESSAGKGEEAPPGIPARDAFGTPSSAIVRRKETSFGSTENVTRTTEAKVTTFPIADGGSGPEAFADFAPRELAPAGEDDDDEFGDFAGTVSEKSAPPVSSGAAGPDGASGEAADDFCAFQGEKAKFGKSDFLKASAQAKVKSSEEMIRSELATFDLSVQGSHKRSHSLGDKEISRSTPPPAPETPFRDRSSTLSEKPALPIIRDKYKDLTGEVEESERYAYEWQRCLESALQVIGKANDTLNDIGSSAVCTEVIRSQRGTDYLSGVVEVYRVTKRVELGIKATAVCSEKLQQLLKDIGRVWNNLMGFMSLASLTPDESSLDFSACILRHGIRNAKELACGVCLLNVDSRGKAFNSETDNFKLLYGGHQYHASCANFWINCVEPKPPGLVLPDLL